MHWFNLTDAAREDALLDSMALRRFVGIDLGRERVPDATTLLKFRELLAEHGGVQDDPLGVPLGEFVRERMHRRHIHPGVWSGLLGSSKTRAFYPCICCVPTGAGGSEYTCAVRSFLAVAFTTHAADGAETASKMAIASAANPA